jgi:hypothetical protein
MLSPWKAVKGMTSMEEKLAAWRVATGKAKVDNSATAKIFGTKKKSPLVPSTSHNNMHNTTKTTHPTGASYLVKKPAQRPVVPKLAGPPSASAPSHCPISPACTDKENEETHNDVVTKSEELQQEEVPKVGQQQQEEQQLVISDEAPSEVIDYVSVSMSEPETVSVDEAMNEPENTPSVPQSEETKSQPSDEDAPAPQCSPQEQTKERRRRRTTMFVKGNATPDDARAKGQPSPLLLSPGLVAARNARRASGGTVLFRDAPALEAPASEDAESSEQPLIDSFHQSEQKLARLSEGSRESQSDSSSGSSGHSSASGKDFENKDACNTTNECSSRRASGAALDRSSLGSESLTTASPYSGQSTRSSLDGMNGEATSIADFFSPFSPEARARYRTAACDNVADSMYATSDAAAGTGSLGDGEGAGGTNQNNNSYSSSSSLADEQQWAEAAAAWEAAAEAMKTSYEHEFAKLEAETSAKLATAEAQVGMALEEQAMLHFLTEVQKQEGEMRAAAFSKTLDQLHSKVKYTVVFLLSLFFSLDQIISEKESLCYRLALFVHVC